MRRNSKGSLIRPEGLPDSSSWPVVTPLSPSVVYASESPDALDDQYEGRAQGFTYSREGHPNAQVVVARLDAMEGAEGGVVTGSGHSSMSIRPLSTKRRVNVRRSDIGEKREAIESGSATGIVWK